MPLQKCRLLKKEAIPILRAMLRLIVHFFSARFPIPTWKQLISFVYSKIIYYIKSVPDLSRFAVGNLRGMYWGKMMYTPQHIANYFLRRADEASLPMTQLKLMKLVYIAYGWMLALTNKKLFEEEIQAWKHGPVIPSIYHEFKHFGSSPISGRAITMDMDTSVSSEPFIDTKDHETAFVLDKVWSVYKVFSGWTLVNKTHEVGTPWQQVYRSGQMEIPIPDDKIKEHYKERINTYLEAAA